MDVATTPERPRGAQDNRQQADVEIQRPISRPSFSRAGAHLITPGAHRRKFGDFTPLSSLRLTAHTRSDRIQPSMRYDTSPWPAKDVGILHVAAAGPPLIV